MPLIITLSDLLVSDGNVRSTILRSNFANMHPEIHLVDELITAGMAIRSPRNKQYGRRYCILCSLSNSWIWHMLGMQKNPHTHLHAMWSMSFHNTVRFLAFATDG